MLAFSLPKALENTVWGRNISLYQNCVVLVKPFIFYTCRNPVKLRTNVVKIFGSLLFDDIPV